MLCLERGRKRTLERVCEGSPAVELVFPNFERKASWGEGELGEP